MSSDAYLVPERAAVIQTFGNIATVRLGLPESVRLKSVSALNRLLAHTIALRDLYKKAHRQTSGATCYGLYLLFYKHCDEQVEMIDALAERVQTLGGVARALARDVVDEGRIARGPSGVETPVDQLRRLVDAHEFILLEARPLAREAGDRGDDGTNDLIVGPLVRQNESQSWFLIRYLATFGSVAS